jgi:putative transposase
LICELKKALAERMHNAEVDVHLTNQAEAGIANHRNGSSAKTVSTPEASLELSIPRDRHGRIDPALIGKYRRRFRGFDDEIIAFYARGMSTRDIQGQVRELYCIEISPDLVSAVTDSAIDEVTAWQARPLRSSYAIVFFDPVGARSAMKDWSGARPCTYRQILQCRLWSLRILSKERSGARRAHHL